MAYAADDFAYIAKRLKEIRANAKRAEDAWLRDDEELPRLQRSGTIADAMRHAPATSRGGALRPL
jgi:hypothetical protein